MEERSGGRCILMSKTIYRRKRKERKLTMRKGKRKEKKLYLRMIHIHLIILQVKMLCTKNVIQKECKTSEIYGA